MAAAKDEVIVLQNDHGVPPGYLLPALEQHGLRARIVVVPETPALPPFDGAAAVVSLGGFQGAYETARYPYLQGEMAYLLAARAAGVPVLGLCLGGQLLAVALGGSGFRAPTSELGFVAQYPVRLTADGLRDPVARALLPSDGDEQDGRINDNVLLFHSDTFTLPPDCTLLAQSTYPQLFRSGSALGVQFHPETEPAAALHWLGRSPPERLVHAGIHDGGVRLRADIAQRAPAAQELGLKFFAAWIKHDVLHQEE